jgi:hypothetical protein
MEEQFDRISSIYEVRDSALHHIVTPGFQTEAVFSAGGGKLCWTELRRHPRWWREDYSVIVTYDLQSGSKETLTHRSSYFMPALSPDGKKIAAVFDDDTQHFTLHILDAETGELIEALPNPHNYTYTYPQWTPDARYLVSAVRLPSGKMTITAFNLEDRSEAELLEPSYAPIGRPDVSAEWIYFTKTTGERDQIYRLHRSAKYLEQVTEGAGSKYQSALAPDGKTIVYTVFTLEGKKLIRRDVDTTFFRLIRKVEAQLPGTVVLEAETDLLSLENAESFAVEKYPLLHRPIRVHSWSIYPDDPVYGIELLSENTLSTTFWRSGYEYNQNSRFHGPFTEVTLGLWYPEIVAGYSGTRVSRTIQSEKLRWWQHNAYAGLRIPFYAYTGPYVQNGFVSSRVNHISTSGDLSDFKLSYLSHTISFSNSRKQASQHARSRFSQAITVRGLHAIDTTSGSQLHIETGFAVPSPIRNHIIGIEFDFRSESSTNTILFSDLFDYARGYDPIRSDEIWRFGLSYELPIGYPDFGVAGIVYFRRLRLRPFYDYMSADGVGFASFGTEFLMDLNLFNVEPVTVGFRWAKRLDLDRGHDFALILPMGF